MSIAIIIVSFIMGLLTDLSWTKYAGAVSKHKAFFAANWSIAIYLCGVFATYLLVDKEYVAMFAYIVGGYIGTYYAVLHGVPRDEDIRRKLSNQVPHGDLKLIQTDREPLE